MKVLQINTWFRAGSTGKIVESLHEHLVSLGVDSYVMFGRGKLSKKDKDSGKVFKNSSSFEAKTNSVFSRLSGCLYGGCTFSTAKALKIIKRIKPDIVHIHCTNSFIINNYKLFKFLGRRNIKTVFTLHAEYLFTGSCSHSLECNQWKLGCMKCPRLKEATRSLLFDTTKKNWKKMYESISTIKTRNVVAVSRWLKEKASLSQTFSSDNIFVIHNGINDSLFKYIELETSDFAYLKEGYKRIYLYLTPNFSDKSSDIKGGDYFLKLTKVFNDNPDILFVVAGGNTHNFDFSLLKNVKYLGNISDPKRLAALYSISDVTLMLSRRETFSMVTAESISCGTKVVGFKSGGPESIAAKDYGVFFEFGDLESLTNYLKNSFKNYKKISTSYYSDKLMAESYYKLYKELYERKI